MRIEEGITVLFAFIGFCLAVIYVDKGNLVVAILTAVFFGISMVALFFKRRPKH